MTLGTTPLFSHVPRERVKPWSKVRTRTSERRRPRLRGVMAPPHLILSVRFCGRTRRRGRLRSYPESEEKPCADPMLRVGNRQGWGKSARKRIPLLPAI